MPTAPPRLCSRCGRRVWIGTCAYCGRVRDRQRGTAAARGYDWLWAAYAREWLARFPWCGQRQDGKFHVEHSRCAAEGRRVRAQVVDHIRSLRTGGARLDPANHQSLCASCNRRKTT